jgi:7,8-dihydroneopterin aldolase/epimerase/oxygenase
MNHTPGKLHIEKYEIQAILGILDFERSTKQKIIIDLEIELDFKKIQEQESKIVVGVDYTELTEMVEQHIVLKEFRLIEDCVLSLGRLVMNQWEQIQLLTINVSKPDAIGKAGNTRASMTFSR